MSLDFKQCTIDTFILPSFPPKQRHHGHNNCHASLPSFPKHGRRLVTRKPSPLVCDLATSVDAHTGSLGVDQSQTFSDDKGVLLSITSCVVETKTTAPPPPPPPPPRLRRRCCTPLTDQGHAPLAITVGRLFTSRQKKQGHHNTMYRRVFMFTDLDGRTWETVQMDSPSSKGQVRW